MNGSIRPVLSAAAALVLGTAIVPSAGGQPPMAGSEHPDYAKQQPGILSKVKFVQKPGAQVPLDLVFRDEDGDPVRLGDLLGDKPVILNLVYYECPLLCNQVLDGLVRNLNVLDDYTVGDDFDVISVSINPAETPELARAKEATVMRAYHYADPAAVEGWHFLTSVDKETVDKLAESVGFTYHYNPKSKLYAHAAGVVFLTPEGVVSRYVYGISFPARDLKLALTEASDGKVGGVLEQALLLCYAYDPESGTYSFAIFNVIRLAGLATLAGLGLYVTTHFIRDWRHPDGPAAGADGDATPPPPTSN